MTAQVIPYAKLYVAAENARADSIAPRDLDRLALSIATVGLIHPLSVYADGERFAVEDGGGRLAALLKLKKAKKLPPDLREGAPCIVSASPDLARTRSIAANEVREEMHPADTILAYKALFESGQPVEAIAAGCGVTAARVARLLRLKDVAPEILAAFKAGEVPLDHVQAYAISDDPAAQLAVFEVAKAAGNFTAWSIKRRLQEGGIPADSALAQFVGVEAYEAAGGKLLVDLFTDREAATWADGALAERLADAKLADIAAEAAKEGWARVIVENPYDSETTWFRAEPEGEADDFSPEERGKLVAFVWLDRWDGVQVEGGFYEPDAEEGDDFAGEADGEAAQPVAEPEKDHALEGWGHAGHGELTRIASAAVKCALLADPAKAEAVLVASLAVQTLHKLRAPVLSLSVCGAADPEAQLAQLASWHAVKAKWAARIPETLAGALEAVAALKPRERSELLALCVGASVAWSEGGLHHFQRAPDAERQLGHVARFLAVDFADHWAPPASWLAKGSKGALLDGLAACGAEGHTDDEKRADLAAALEREAVKARWVPKVLADLAAAPAPADADEPEVDPALIAAE